MKKNLRIVSAAAAALLAVAPVAASAVSTVSASEVSNINSNTQGNNINWGIGSLATNATANIKPNLTLTTQNKFAGITKSSLTGNITATVDGTSYTALYAPADAQDAGTSITVKDDHGNTVNNGSELTAGETYTVTVSSLKFNFGSANANKKITLTLPAGETFEYDNKGAKQSHEVTTNSAGVVELKNVTLKVTAHDYADPATVMFVNRATGVQVTSGNVDMVANAQGNANVNTVAAAINAKYTAMQVRYENGTNGSDTATVNNQGVKEVVNAAAVKDALKSANISVDANGFFKAPHTLTVNATATSAINSASTKMPVTVTFTNVAVPAPTVEASKSATVMHNAYFYDKDGKRVGSDKAATYSSIELATDAATKSGYKEATIGGKTYYKVANKDEYINASNVTGTKKTLKKNAYVYKTSKKRANKVTLKKGSEVTVYGSAVKLANGKSYYRIGQTKYVKKANF